MKILPVVLSLCLIPSLATPCHAVSSNDPALEEAALAQLEAHAQQARPREECFLYTEIIHQMTEIAGKQLLAGDSDRASATLKRIEHYTWLIHSGLTRDTRKLKETEMLMHGASRRLGEYLHLLSPEDKAVVQSALKELDKVNEELLSPVFAR